MKSIWMLALVSLAVAACGDSGGDSSEAPRETPTPTQYRPTATPHDADDFPMIDAVRRAIASGDASQLEALFVFQEVPCSAAGEGPGGPPLCRGEPDGTVVRVAPMSTCEGYYAREGELMLEQAVTGDAVFFAAYRFTGPDFWGNATYAVVFSLPDRDMGPLSYAILATDEGATSVFYACGWAATAWADFPGFGERIDGQG